MGWIMGDIGACGPSTPTSVVSAQVQHQAPVKPEVTLVEPVRKKDTAEISDAARARLASERQQDRTYAAQVTASQGQASVSA